MRLTGQTCRIDDVSREDRAQMFWLMQQNYHHVDRDTFEADFRQKDWVIVARTPGDDRVQGFSTQTVYWQKAGGRRVRILFSGDTIVDRKYWSSNPLSQLWGRLALSLIDSCPDQPLYWFLISKGYKTYRFLPVFFREFYPRYDRPTPAAINDLISDVAVARYGSRYDHGKGIITACPNGCRLRESVAAVTADRLKNPHVAFFDRVNPGHVQGDELCCLAPLSRHNFNRKALRVIGTDRVPLVLDCGDRDFPRIPSGE
jgi:hypothetical protein